MAQSIADAGDHGFPILVDADEQVVDAYKLIAGRVAQQLSILANQ